MTRLRLSLVASVVLVACTPSGGDGGSGGAESGVDATTDATFETTPEASVDARSDTATDGGADSSTDAATDSAVDSAMDSAVDARGDASSDGDGCALPDGGSLDPAVTPVGTPTGATVSKVIGASGGTIATADGRATLVVPAGALPADTTLTLTSVGDECPGGVGDAYRIAPAGTSFATPATLTFHVLDAEIRGLTFETLGVANQHADDEWYPVELASTTYDHPSQTVSAPISQAGDWAPFATMKVDDADFSPDAVFVDDSKDFQVFSTYDTGSVTGPLHGWAPAAGFVVEWSVNGIVGGDSTVGTISDVGTVTCFGATAAAHYTAPSEVPTTPVMVQGSFTFPGRPLTALLSAQISVFYHHYSLAFHYHNHRLCPTDPSTVELDDDNGTTTAAFSLDSSFHVTLDSPGALTDATVTDMNACACPAGWTCTFGLDTTASPVTPGVEITDASGGYDPAPKPGVPYPDGATRTLHLLLTGTFSDLPATVRTNTMPFVPPDTSREPALQEPFDPVTYPALDTFLYMHGYNGEVLQFNKYGPGPCAAGTNCDEWTFTLSKAP